MPTSALPTMVQPTPAPVLSAFGAQQAVGYASPQPPQHKVAVTPATGLGVSVAPVTLLVDQGNQPIVVTAAQTTPSAAAIATCNAVASSSALPANTYIVSANATTAMQGASVSFLNAALGATYPPAVVSTPPVTAALKTSETEHITAVAPARSQPADTTAQTNAGPASIQTPSAPVVIVKQPNL